MPAIRAAITLSHPDRSRAKARSGGTCVSIVYSRNSCHPGERALGPSATAKTVVILRSAFWDPFGEAEWACATKDLLLNFAFAFVFVFSSSSRQSEAEPALSEANGRDPYGRNHCKIKKHRHPDRSRAKARRSGGTCFFTSPWPLPKPHSTFKASAGSIDTARCEGTATAQIATPSNKTAAPA